MKQHAYVKSLLAAAIAVCAVESHANLVDQGNGTIYDTGINAAWTSNANLFKTLAAGNASLVANVISSVDGTITDASGTYYLNGTDFDTNAGTLDWYGAQAWVSYLNTTNYAGHSNWRLPSLAPVNGSSFNTSFSYDGSTDVGYNNSASNSELGHLFYTELGNSGFYSTTGAEQAPYGVTNTGAFTNLASAVYWSGAEASDSSAYYFSTLDGLQSSFDKTTQYNVLAVAPVPLPGTLFLLSSGIGAVGIMRRRQSV